MPSKDAAMVRMGINLGSPEEEAKAKHEMGMKLAPARRNDLHVYNFMYIYIYLLINLFVYIHVYLQIYWWLFIIYIYV